MTDAQSLLSENFPEEAFEFNKILSPLTYFKIGGPAEIFLEITTINQFKKILEFVDRCHIKLTILGGSSNVIISDSGIPGLVVTIKANSVAKNSDANVEAEAGIKTALLVSQTIQMGYTGLEYFLGVPGTLGGAVFNNAHYLNQLIDEHISEVLVIDHAGKETWLDHTQCDFRYEHSRFQKTKEIIWKVKFSLKPGSVDESRAMIKEATEYRAKTQPLGIPSSGCIFQNVPNTDELKKLFPNFSDEKFVPGGFIIDQAGLKGLSNGDIEVSEKHAAWMINKGHGTSSQVKSLISEVKERVKDKFGINLEEEVFFLE